MIVRNKAWHVYVSSLVFFIACQLSTLALFQKMLICNSGIGFSINIPVFALIPAIIVSTLFIGGMFRTMLREKTSGYIVIASGGLFFGGTLSNIADRFLRGCVPDFFHIFFFPTFNVADIGISVGTSILFILLILKKNT